MSGSSPAVVEPDDEVGQVAPRCAAVAIGHLEAHALVLHVGEHARMALERQRQLRLPVAVETTWLIVALRRLRAGRPARSSR